MQTQNAKGAKKKQVAPKQEKKAADQKKDPVKIDKKPPAPDKKKEADKPNIMDVNQTKQEVEAYMLKHNRPYSVQDILNCFQQTMRKKQCEGALDLLVSSKKVTLKEYGKAKVYLISQDRFPKVDPKLLETLDLTIADKRIQVNKINDISKDLDKGLKEALSTLTNQ